MPTVRRTTRDSWALASLALPIFVAGCANSNLPFGIFGRGNATDHREIQACVDANPIGIGNVEQEQLFRKAETQRATNLIQEIERLQADLKTAEAALVEAESGLSSNHTRADAISSLAVMRIQIDRVAARAPWRAAEIAGALAKLQEAERQVDENRFGAALFFVYRARRVADSILAEAELVDKNANVRHVQAARVNLRTGPAQAEAVLAVLTMGTPVFPQATEGDWLLVQVSGGPSGWIHQRFVGNRLVSDANSGPASARP